MRATASVVLLLLTTAAFCDFACGLTPIGRRLAEIQMLPAILSMSAIWVVFWLAATLLFGRIYCSTICPMGTLMDICARLPKFRRDRSKAYHHTPGDPTMRVSILVGVIFLACLSLPLGLTVLDPVTVYGHATEYISVLVRSMTSANGGKTFVLTVSSLNAILLTFGLIIAACIVSYRSGRTVCNTVCPVGTVLGLPAAYSRLHMDINTDLCTNCYDCVHACKSHCIDLTTHLVDTSRCVVCFDCASVCENNAITYRTGRHRLGMPLVERLAEQTLQVPRKAALDFRGPTEKNNQKNIFPTSCDNISTFCSTSSTTARKKPTAPGQEQNPSSAIRCASTSRKASHCSRQKNSTSSR